jgi:hypothetical protein
VPLVDGRGACLAAATRPITTRHQTSAPRADSHATFRRARAGRSLDRLAATSPPLVRRRSPPDQSNAGSYRANGRRDANDSTRDRRLHPSDARLRAPIPRTSAPAQRARCGHSRARLTGPRRGRRREDLDLKTGHLQLRTLHAPHPRAQRSSTCRSRPLAVGVGRPVVCAGLP